MLGLEGHVGLSKTCVVPAGLGDYVRLQKVQGPPLSRHHGILRGELALRHKVLAWECLHGFRAVALMQGFGAFKAASAG